MIGDAQQCPQMTNPQVYVYRHGYPNVTFPCYLRCSNCGQIPAAVTWVRGGYGHSGFFACDACLRRYNNETLLVSVGCAFLCLMPPLLLLLWIVSAFIRAIV